MIWQKVGRDVGMFQNTSLKSNFSLILILRKFDHFWHIIVLVSPKQPYWDNILELYVASIIVDHN